MNLNFSIIPNAEAPLPPNPTIYPPCGPVTGVFRKNVTSYKGIPFAKPPVGPLRFRPPEPAPAWISPRECFEFSDKCLQFGGILADLPPMYSAIGKSEDCLYLNVWTPATEPGEKRPVYVYVHGGGFATGSGSELMFDGTNMAERGVVVVTFNYRLGAFGFLTLGAMEEESGSAGNFGLLDQIQALKWVRENIEAFGGDPENITLGGESAGAFSVTGLLLSPLAKGLFHRAIVESGSILSIGAFCTRAKGNLAKSIAMGKDFAQIFGADDSPEGLEKLREAPAEAMAYLSMIKADRALPLRFSFWPVFDGVILPKDPMQALKNGDYNAVDLLIGYNTNEATLFFKSNNNFGSYQMMIYDLFGADNAPAVFERFPIEDERKAERQLEAIFTHTGFILGMRIIADYFADAGRNVFFYNFNYDPAILKIVGLDTAHSLELPFVFGNAIGKMRISKISILSDQMQTHWTNFMKTGNPNTGGEYKNMMFWPFYNTRTRQLMVFDKELSNKTMPDADTLDFLQNLLYGEKPYYL